MQLLELVAYFDVNQTFPCIYILAKQIYKIVRQIPSLSLRLQRLKNIRKKDRENSTNL